MVKHRNDDAEMRENRIALMSRLGEPTKVIETPQTTLEIWLYAPISVTRLQGFVSVAFAKEIEKHFIYHFNQYEKIVTIHEWSGMTDYETKARKILQQLTKTVQSKQRELIIHLGKADTPAQKIARSTIEIITQFRKIPIELFSEDEKFEARATELFAKYKIDL